MVKMSKKKSDKIGIRIISLLFILLIIGSSFSAAEITPNSAAANENFFGEQDTGESVILEAYKYQPKTGVPVGLLEKQDVPVYVSLKATTLGGLISGKNSEEGAPFYGLPEIQLVSAPRITGADRRFVSGITFIPNAKRGQSLVDDSGRFIDIGYFIVRLHKIEKESDLPGFREKGALTIANVSDIERTSFLQTGGGTIDLNVSVDIRFNSENSLFGFGSSDLLLKENADEESWKKSVTIKDSFWNGKGYVRAARIDDKTVNLVLYDNALRRMGSYSLTSGQESGVIPLYASNSFQLIDRFRIQLRSIDTASDKAMFLVNGDLVVRGKGQRLIDGSDWVVDKIVPKKVIDDKTAREEVYLKNVKLFGEPKYFKRDYAGNFVGAESTSNVFPPAPSTTSTTLPFTGPPTPLTNYDNIIYKYANEKNVDINLIRAIIKTESDFNPNSISYCGAAGLMQLMPLTALENGALAVYSPPLPYKLPKKCSEDYAGKLNDWYKKTDKNLVSILDKRFDPDANIKTGVTYLKKQIDNPKFKNDIRWAVAAYNAGPGNEAILDCYSSQSVYEKCSALPSETKDYVNKVVKAWNEYNSASPVSTATKTDFPKIEATKMEPDCGNFKDFDALAITKETSAEMLHCKSIRELEKAVAANDDEDLRGESYYWIAENYYAMDSYHLALENYNKVTGSYRRIAEGKIVEVGDKIKMGVSTESKKYLDDEDLDVRFLGVEELKPGEGPEAYISVDGRAAQKMVLDDVIGVSGLKENGRDYTLKVESIQNNQAILRKVYLDGSLGGQISLALRGKKEIDDNVKVSLELIETKSKDNALITILPGSGKSISRSDVMLHIPVEQRAIQFSAGQIDAQINATAAMIKKLDATINKMDTWLQRWKKVCLGVYAFLSVKNFFKGLATSQNDLKARDLVYHGVDGKSGVDDKICNQDNVGYGKKYKNRDSCLLDNSKILEGYVESAKKSLNEIDELSNNQAVKNLNSGKKLSQAEIDYLYGKIYREGGKNEKSEKNNFEILINNKGVTGDELIKAYKNQKLAKAYSDENVLGVDSKGIAEGYSAAYNGAISNINSKSEDYVKREEFKKNSGLDKQGLAEYIYDTETSIQKSKNAKDKTTTIYKDGTYYYVKSDSGNVLKLKPREDNGKIIPGEFVCFDADVKTRNKGCVGGKDNQEIVSFKGDVSNYGEYLGTYVDTKIKIDRNGRVTFMPYDVKGQYVEILEWYENGEPKTFRILGYRNSNGEQELVVIHHQSEIDSNPELRNKIASYGRNARCKDGQRMTIQGVSFTCELDKAVEAVDRIECQEVMSATDCKILFNVCDPVICPASRFDLGGRWKIPPGRSVVDTGLFGSLTLGMPNFVGFGGQNVVPPICAPGVLASLESWRSMLQAYNQCMITSKTTGKTVGICDAIRSVYLCELLWREAGSFGGFLSGLTGINSKLFDVEARGGGEYTNFQASLAGVGDSAQFFTSEYGKSSFAAYKSRSFSEAGTEVCRQMYFGKAPGIGDLMDSLSAPESPPQFTAYFDSFEWASDYGTTQLNRNTGLLNQVKEQSRYSVYYHIYAGRNKEVRYSVWLQDRTGSVKVPVTDENGVFTRGLVKKGEYADKKIDILAGTGLEQICVEIDGNAQCGFGKVSTGLLLNYINDVLVKNEVGKEITTEKDCIGDNSLGPSAAGIALPTQAGIGTSAVRRICSLNDPDNGKTSGKWQVVGSCGKGKTSDGKDIDYGSCWIDTSSLNFQFKNLDEQAQESLNALNDKYQEILNKEEQARLIALNELFNKLETLFKEKVDENLVLRDKGNVKPNEYLTVVKDVSELIIHKPSGDDYLYLVENDEVHAGIAQLRIGELYYTIADLKKKFEVSGDFPVVVAEEIKDDKDDKLKFDDSKTYVYWGKVDQLLPSMSNTGDFSTFTPDRPVFYLYRGASGWVWNIYPGKDLTSSTKTKDSEGYELEVEQVNLLHLLENVPTERIIRVLQSPESKYSATYTYKSGDETVFSLQGTWDVLRHPVDSYTWAIVDYKYINGEWMWKDRTSDQVVWNSAGKSTTNDGKTPLKHVLDFNAKLKDTVLIPDSIWDAECEDFYNEPGNYMCTFFVGEQAQVKGTWIKLDSLVKGGSSGGGSTSISPSFTFNRDGKLLTCGSGLVGSREAVWQVSYRDTEGGGRTFDKETVTKNCDGLDLTLTVLGYNANKNQLLFKVNYNGPFEFSVKPEVFDVQQDKLLKATVNFKEISWWTEYVSWMQKNPYAGSVLEFKMYDKNGVKIHTFDPIKIDEVPVSEKSYDLDLTKIPNLDKGLYFIKLSMIFGEKNEVVDHAVKVVAGGATNVGEGNVAKNELILDSLSISPEVIPSGDSKFTVKINTLKNLESLTEIQFYVIDKEGKQVYKWIKLSIPPPVKIKEKEYGYELVLPKEIILSPGIYFLKVDLTNKGIVESKYDRFVMTTNGEVSVYSVGSGTVSTKRSLNVLKIEAKGFEWLTNEQKIKIDVAKDGKELAQIMDQQSKIRSAGEGGGDLPFLKLAIEADPGNVYVLWKIGFFYYVAEGDDMGAVKYFDELVRINPGFAMDTFKRYSEAYPDYKILKDYLEKAKTAVDS